MKGERKMRRRCPYLSIVACFVFLTGCATIQQRFNVEVDSIASPVASVKKSYVLLPGNEGVTWDDLQFQEYAVYLVRALAAKGYTLAQSVDKADIAIVTFYGIGDPQTNNYSFSLPVRGETGVSSSNTSGTAYVSGNTATYSGTTTYTPRYGITGYKTITGSYTTYFRYALIAAYDLQAFKKSQKEVQVWKTTITSIGSSGDLRRIFPILIAGAAPYIGSNTGQQVQIQLYETDEIVRDIKGLPANQDQEKQSKP